MPEVAPSPAVEPRPASRWRGHGSPSEASADGASHRLALATLGLGAFVMGTAELLVVGVLDLVADDMGVAVGSAGALVTAYALGISIGGPLLTAASMRLARRHVLLVALALHVAGSAVAFAAPTFDLLLAARVLTGSAHGLFVGVAFAVAGSLVPAHMQGRAISIVMGGVTVAMIVGVPLGTLLGSVVSWRGAFAAVVILGAAALAAAALLVPPVAARGVGSFATQARAALAPRVLALLGVGLLLMGGQFTAFTYLAPYLGEVTGISATGTFLFLLVYGIAAAVGTFLGGRAADRNATRTLTMANALLLPALGLLYLLGSTAALAALALTAWAIVGLGLVPALQLRVISLARDGGDLAATLGTSAINAGIAGGAFIGGAVVAGDGVGAAPLAAIIICAATFPLTWATGFLRGPAADNLEPAMAGNAEAF